MIIEGILTVILTLAKSLFSFINLPQFPEVITNVMDEIMTYIKSGTTFVLFFYNMQVFRACITLVIALISFKYAYKFIMFVVGVIGRIKSGVEL